MFEIAKDIEQTFIPLKHYVIKGLNNVDIHVLMNKSSYVKKLYITLLLTKS